MGYIEFSCQQALDFLNQSEFSNLSKHIEDIHQTLHSEKEQNQHPLGWLNWPKNYDPEEFNRIMLAADKIRNNSDILLVIGIGGSYLGARAAIDMLNHSFQHLLHTKQSPEIIFAGHHLSGAYIQELFDILKDRDVSINVISKSGKTTETAISFRIFRQYLEKKYGKQEAKERIFVTTDQKKGPLKTIAEEKNYESFHIPRDIGGRYSVLTSVGLLPMAVSGININAVMQGAKQMMNDLEESLLTYNPAYQYAATRYLLYREGKTIELFVSYEPCLQSFGEWWRQLFGESEGKENQGIFPTSASFTTDLHAIGQYIQEGRRDLFETILHVNQTDRDTTLPSDNQNEDDLNDLSGEFLHKLNHKAFQASLLAHHDGGVPNLIIELPAMNAYTFGALTFFFQKACAMSGYLFNVNPFDQPGVEAYKQNMSALLGKPGFEEKRGQLEKRLNNSYHH